MIQIGIIGKGEQINLHLSNIFSVKGFKVIGIYVTDNVRVPEDEVQVFFDYQEVLNNSDAIYLLETNESPFEIIQLAFRLGKHVFIEQISLLSLDEIEQLLITNNEANVKCVIGNATLSHPAYLSIKNEINTPIYIESQRSMMYDKKNTKHIILHDMLQDLAVILDKVKSDIKRIWASGFKVMDTQIDFANVRLEFSNGIVANITVNKGAMFSNSMISFYEKGRVISCNFQDAEVKIDSKSGSSIVKPNTDEFPLDKVDPIVYQLENFRDTILNDIQPILKLRDGYEKLDIAYKILKKIESFSEE